MSDDQYEKMQYAMKRPWGGVTSEEHDIAAKTVIKHLVTILGEYQKLGLADSPSDFEFRDLFCLASASMTALTGIRLTLNRLEENFGTAIIGEDPGYLKMVERYHMILQSIARTIIAFPDAFLELIMAESEE